MMKRLYKNLVLMSLALLVVVLGSCSGSDYLNAIPKKSTALISVDLQQMASDKNAEDKAGMLKSLLHVDDVDKCGTSYRGITGFTSQESTGESGRRRKLRGSFLYP